MGYSFHFSSYYRLPVYFGSWPPSFYNQWWLAKPFLCHFTLELTLLSSLPMFKDPYDYTGPTGIVFLFCDQLISNLGSIYNMHFCYVIIIYKFWELGCKPFRGHYSTYHRRVLEAVSTWKGAGAHGRSHVNSLQCWCCPWGYVVGTRTVARTLKAWGWLDMKTERGKTENQ